MFAMFAFYKVAFKCSFDGIDGWPLTESLLDVLSPHVILGPQTTPNYSFAEIEFLTPCWNIVRSRKRFLQPSMDF